MLLGDDDAEMGEEGRGEVGDDVHEGVGRRGTNLHLFGTKCR
jgi:hypothetical protein